MEPSSQPTPPLPTVPLQDIPIIPEKGFDALSILKLGGGALAVLIAGGALFMYGWNNPDPASKYPPPVLALEEETVVFGKIVSSVEAATLKDEIPTVAPTANPIENIYKNPFE